MKALLITLLFACPPFAHADVELPKKDNACAKDHIELCPHEKPKTKSFLDCMQKHESELAPECKEVIEKLAARFADAKETQKKAREACSDDFFKLCPGVPFEEAERKACLRKHKRQLSEDCAKTLK